MSTHWKKLDEYSKWRKIAMGMWEAPEDPTIYGKETVDVSNLVDYLDAVTEASGTKVTMTAYASKCMADVLGKYPDLNVMPIGPHIVQRERVDVFCQVAIPDESAGSADLSGVKLRDADEMGLVEIAERLRSKATDVREGKEVEMEESKSMVDDIPNSLMSVLTDVLDFLTYRVPIDLDALGIRSDPFGSCMVTSVSQFDIIQGFAPLLPGSHCPLVVLPGKIYEAPFVEDGEVVAREAVDMSCTFDHRCYDGLQIGYIVRDMRNRLMHPTDFYPEASHWAESTSSDAEAEPAEATDEQAAAAQ